MQKSKIKIALIIPSMKAGGAERVALNMINSLDRRRFEPHLALFDAQGEFIDSIGADVKLHSIDKKSRWDVFRMIFALKRLIADDIDADIAISHLEYANLITLLAAFFSSRFPPIFVVEHSCPSRHARMQRWSAIRNFLLRRLYKRAACVIAVSGGVKSDLESSFGIPPSKIRVIYNGIDLELIEKNKRLEPEEQGLFSDSALVVCAAGRLKPEKNYPLLLDAFAAARLPKPSRLIILGEGSEKQRLEDQCARLKIKDRVMFLGFKVNPYQYIARSDVFVLSSDFEGFPCVLLEAMACATPIIATDCPSGPGELIISGESGILTPVGDARAMTSALEKMLIDRDYAVKLKENGLIKAQKYSIPKMTAGYEELFARCPTWNLDEDPDNK
jgi:glycosyltransferase involved in cell wall biosynthesis